jgi:heptosyltransferase II
MKLNKKILVIHTGGIGDVIMARPTIQLVSLMNPFHRLDFLGNPLSLEVLRGDRWVKNLIRFPSSRKTISSAIKALCILLRLRLERYDKLYLLQPALNKKSHMRLHCLIDFIAPKTSVGRKSSFGADFYDESVAEHKELHEVERMLHIVTKTNVGKVSKNDYLLSPMYKEMIRGTELVDKPFAVISPGGVKSCRRWPSEKFIEISYRFSELGLNVVFVGSKNEENVLENRDKQLPQNALNLIGKTKLNELCALIARSKITVGNDSGTMHLANALDVPVVGIFGSGDATRTRPYLEEKARIVDSPPLHCKPCYDEFCKTLECMELIPVDGVWNAVRELL